MLEGLRCNGDDDCGDGSDEQGCKKFHKACNQPTEEYYGIENLAKGFDTPITLSILTSLHYLSFNSFIFSALL